MSRLEELLANPSPESWREIVEIGKTARRSQIESWTRFCSVINDVSLAAWPPEIERLCPASWPREFRDAVEHRVRETDTYGHYLAKICAHPDLKLSDGSQAVWLERRFTGGIVPVSTTQQALRTLSSALNASSVKACYDRIKLAINILSNGVRNVGKVGCADLTGGVVVEEPRDNYDGTMRCIRHEYRLEVEVKVGDEPQRPEQVARMNSVRARGGCYVLARSVEEAIAEIKRFRDSR